MTDKREQDYLWDGTGEADPELLELEQTLGSLRYTGSAPTIPTVRKSSPLRWIAVAAAVLAAVGGAVWIALQTPTNSPVGPTTAWPVRVVSGAATIASRSLPASPADAQLPVGQWLETAADSRAELKVANIGSLAVKPRTRLRVVNTGAREHRIQLARGQIHAVVNAPPRLFVVETPSAVAVDLGCEYELSVTDNGDSTLHVTSGWVALEGGSKSSLVPAGARCETRKGRGPGTPYFVDAPPALKAALRRFDSDGNQQAIDDVLAVARPRDSLTLWHMGLRVNRETRARIAQKMMQLRVPLPRDPQLERVLVGDKEAFRGCSSTLRSSWSTQE